MGMTFYEYCHQKAVKVQPPIEIPSAFADVVNNAEDRMAMLSAFSDSEVKRLIVYREAVRHGFYNDN